MIPGGVLRIEHVSPFIYYARVSHGGNQGTVIADGQTRSQCLERALEFAARYGVEIVNIAEFMAGTVEVKKA